MELGGTRRQWAYDLIAGASNGDSRERPASTGMWCKKSSHTQSRGVAGRQQPWAADHRVIRSRDVGSTPTIPKQPSRLRATGTRQEAVCHRVRRLAGSVGKRTQGALSRFFNDSSCCDGQRRASGATVSSLTLRAGKNDGPEIRDAPGQGKRGRVASMGRRFDVVQVFNLV